MSHRHFDVLERYARRGTVRRRTCAAYSSAPWLCVEAREAVAELVGVSIAKRMELATWRTCLRFDGDGTVTARIVLQPQRDRGVA